MKSDIFENFLKIAEDKKLLDLYHVEPDSIYEKNIMESAHKTPAVLLPAHDPLNGLVENEIEHQNIMLRIVNQRPTGTYTAKILTDKSQFVKKKNAEQDLALNLIRLGNFLDGKNDELRGLSDHCLNDLKKQSDKRKNSIYKTAGWFLPIIGVVTTILGATFYQQNAEMANEGFELNHKRLVDEISDLTHDTESWGVGYKFKQEFKNEMMNFKTKLESFKSEYNKYSSILYKIQKPRSGKELLEKAKDVNADEILKAFEDLKTKFEDMKTYIISMKRNLDSESYKGLQKTDRGFFTGILDVIPLGRKLISDDFQDISRAIPPYLASVQEILKVLQDSTNLMNSSKEKIEESLKDIDSKEKKIETVQKDSVKSIDTMADEISKDEEELKKLLKL